MPTNTIRLTVLVASTLLSGCATLPESAYYRYEPSTTPPATVEAGNVWAKHVFYSLFLVPPTLTRVEGVDGKIVKSSSWKPNAGRINLSPGRHHLRLNCIFDRRNTFADLEADFSSGKAYVVKAENTPKNLYSFNFFIEEKATKRRIAEGPGGGFSIRPRIYIPVMPVQQ